MPCHAHLLECHVPAEIAPGLLSLADHHCLGDALPEVILQRHGEIVVELPAGLVLAPCCIDEHVELR